MDVVILAGGLGTRLSSIVSDVPKPMAPVNGKPFLEYILLWLEKFDISNVFLSVGYKKEVIQDYFGDNFNGMPITYAVEDKPLGTGGGIINALQLTTSKDVLIVNGDTYFPIDINDLASFHNQNNSAFTIALKQMVNFDRYGTVEIENTSIRKFNEKQYAEAGLINGGIYLVNRNFLMTRQFPEVFSFEKEVLELEADKGTLSGKAFDNDFIDIGIPEDYYLASKIL